MCFFPLDIGFCPQNRSPKVIKDSAKRAWLAAPFSIEVKAKWIGTAKNLSLILNGPGKRGY